MDDSAPTRVPPKAPTHKWHSPYSALCQTARRLSRPVSKTDVRDTLDKAKPLLEEILRASDPEALPVLDGLFRMLPMYVSADQDLVRQVYGVNHAEAQLKMLEGMLKRAEEVSSRLMNPPLQNPGESYGPGLSLRNSLMDWAQSRELPARLYKKRNKVLIGLGNALLRYELRGVFGQPPDCVWEFTVKRSAEAQDDVAEALVDFPHDQAKLAYFLMNPDHPSYPQWIVETRGRRGLGKRIGMVHYGPVKGDFPFVTPFANIIYPDIVTSTKMIELRDYREAYFRDLVRLFREDSVRDLTKLKDLVLRWDALEPDGDLVRELCVGEISRTREQGRGVVYYAFRSEVPYARPVRLELMTQKPADDIGRTSMR